MGEAKRRHQSKDVEFRCLEEMFRLHNVNTSEFGFYDQPAFVEHEESDPDYLTHYARWVTLRPINDTYRSRVKSIVPKLTGLISSSFSQDEWEGSCVAASALMSRMLDRLDVWSFSVVGSAIFSINNPTIWRGLHIVDHQDFPGAALGHAWVCAPPYYVVDPSAALQRWGTDPIRDYIPHTILDDIGYRTRPTAEDVVSSRIRQEFAMKEGRTDPNLHHRLRPDLRDFGRHFPATQTTAGPLTIKYIPIAIRQTDTALEEINTHGGIGRTGRELWDHVVKPAFSMN